jgi:hypothetical protein
MSKSLQFGKVLATVGLIHSHRNPHSKGEVVMTEPSINESRDIDASAARIFSILSNPAMHPEVDGTGMLRSAVDDTPVSRVGDVFYINMEHWDRGKYVIANHVVEFEQDRRIVWEPVTYSQENSEHGSLADQPALHQWGWELEPLGDERTRVTGIFEGSRLPEGLREFIEDGEFWRPAMATSLENLERIVTHFDGELPESRQAPKFTELYEGD